MGKMKTMKTKNRKDEMRNTILPFFTRRVIVSPPPPIRDSTREKNENMKKKHETEENCKRVESRRGIARSKETEKQEEENMEQK